MTLRLLSSLLCSCAPLVFAALPFLAPARAAVLLDLDASTLSEGPLISWPNRAPSGGALASTNPVPVRVETLAGRRAVLFNGTQRLVSDFPLPPELCKGGPFTVEAWALNPELDRTETLVSFALPKGGLGTEFNFGSGPTAGAFRSGHKTTLPFGLLPRGDLPPFVQAPAAGDWHHLAWTCSGGPESRLKVYVDGELDAERGLRAGMPPLSGIFVGASSESDRGVPRKGFTGALARVRIRDECLDQPLLRKEAGLEHAFDPSPRRGSVVPGPQVRLAWKAGLETISSTRVHLGTNTTAVARGDAATLIPSRLTEAGPVDLTLGAVYHWRVIEVLADGREIPGTLWTFTADPGLASAPSPRDNDGNAEASLNRLAWKPGPYATRQRVYFGPDRAVVEQGRGTAAELAPAAAEWTLSTPLTAGTRYFWRVESENGEQPTARGQVWTFRTRDAPLTDEITFFVGSDTHYGRESNATINRKVIDEMNRLPGTAYPSSVGGGLVRTPLGVVLTGDLLDEGFIKESAPANWAEFCKDYGLTGRDGRLSFPLYEGFGNHDGGPSKSFVRAGMRERNPLRMGLSDVSPNGLHYSWDWGPVHCLQLNLFGGSGPADVKGVNGPEHDPELALEFLRADLAKHVGSSGRLVIVFQHFGWLGGMADWWTMEAKQRFYEEVKPYRVAALINGHSHGVDFIPWNSLLTVHAGSTARGESDTGDFLVVRVTRDEVAFVQRKLGEWGHYRRKRHDQPADAPRPK